MKKNYSFIIAAIILISLVFSCTKEVEDDLIIFFEVEVDETTTESLLNIPKATEFNFTIGPTSETEEYQFKYQVIKGSGFYTMDSQMIEEDEFVLLPAGAKFIMEYTGSVVGQNEIAITIKNRENRPQDLLMNYNVGDTKFTFNAVPRPASAYIEGTIDLNLNITEVTPATYETKYTFIAPDTGETGKGVISINNNDLEPNTNIETQAGDFTWQFKGVALGTVDVLFTTTSSVGVIVEKRVPITITDIPEYTFTAESNTNSNVTTNKDAEINFNITETVGASLYTMKYTTTNTGSLRYNDVVYQPGAEIPIPSGESKGIYTGTVMGEHAIEFTVVNANTIPIENKANVVLNYKDLDESPPTITLNGDSEITVNAKELFEDPGAKATDNTDGDLTAKIIVTGTVNINTPGEYTLVYTVADSSENTATVSRVVTVVDLVAPVITVNTPNPLVIQKGKPFTDPGAKATDNVDGDLTSKIIVTGTTDVDVNTLGEYTVTYSVTDSSGNTTKATRTVSVINDNPPTLTLTRGTPLPQNAKEQFTDPGATATDDIDDDATLTRKITVIGSVNTNIPGDYTLTYSVTDSSGNTTTAKRVVQVRDKKPPVITLIGGSRVTIEFGVIYSDLGATATDNVDGNVTSKIIITGEVLERRIGDYTLTYTVKDKAGNTATAKRVVQVRDSRPPVITMNRLNGRVDIVVDAGDPFTDPGATATDEADGTIAVVTGGTYRNTRTPGTYTITYEARDKSNNMARAERKVTVRSVTPNYDNRSRLLRANPGEVVTLSITGTAPAGANYDASVRALERFTGGGDLIRGGIIRINQNNPSITNLRFTMPANGEAYIRTKITGDARATAGGRLSISGRQFSYTVSR